MGRMSRSFFRIAAASALAAAFSACSPAAPTMAPAVTPVSTAAALPPAALPTPTTPPAGPTVTSASPAAGVRAEWDRLLGEHVILISLMSGAGMGGRSAEFDAYLEMLDANSVDMADYVGSIYGESAGATFLEFWLEHTGEVVDYIEALEEGNSDQAEHALEELVEYAFELGDFFEEINPNIRSAELSGRVEAHVNGLQSMIEGYAANDPARTYPALRRAYKHMDELALALALGTAAQFPDTYGGSPDGPAADARAALNQLLQEHVGLAFAATGAALGGRTAEFNAAAAEINANAADLAALITLLYGESVGEQFLNSWAEHVNILVEYTTAVAQGDSGKADLAQLEMTTYATDFGALINKVNPLLWADGVRELFKMHGMVLVEIVDAQAAGDHAAAAAALHRGLSQMGLIADPFAEAFVLQSPDLFR
ncbi:MAG TPA: hypothetical protein VGA32_04825 [Anaerolineales bacterium]